MDLAVILNEAQFPEFVHEEIDSGVRCANHLGQHLLRHFGKYLLRLVLVAVMREQQKSSRQPFLAVYESLLPESIHEQIDSRARGPDHLRQNLVAQDGNLNSRWAFFTQVRQPQEHARQSLFRRGSQQVRHVILIVLDAGLQIGHQGIRLLILFSKYLEHLCFLNGTYGAGQRDGRGPSQPNQPPEQTKTASRIGVGTVALGFDRHNSRCEPEVQIGYFGSLR